MRVTIEEAKTKWCPLARVQGEQSTYNRLNTGAPSKVSMCIGTQCMAFKPMTFNKDPDSPLAGLYYCGAFGIG